MRGKGTSGEEKNSDFESDSGGSNLCSAARLVVLGKLLNISESFCEEDNYRAHLTRLW